MIHRRSIPDLLPVVALKATAFVAACRAIGGDVLITSTLRDAEAQTALYVQGLAITRYLRVHFKCEGELEAPVFGCL